MSSDMILPLVIIAVLVVLAILSFVIDWVDVAARLFGDKPNCGKMFIWNGKGYSIENGRLVHQGPEGEIYHYEYNKHTYEVRTGNNYPWHYVKRARMIKCIPGVLYAQPFFEGDLNEPQFTEAEIGTQTLSYIMVELDRSIRGKGLGSMILWVIIGVVVLGAAGYFIYNNLHTGSTPIPAITPTPSNTPGGTLKPLSYLIGVITGIWL
jgi:hypothetical protein